MPLLAYWPKTELRDRTPRREELDMPIEKSSKIWMNGELVDWDDATVHVLTHTLHYGNGAFEGIRAYETCLLYTSPSPRDKRQSRMPSSA